MTRKKFIKANTVKRRKQAIATTLTIALFFFLSGCGQPQSSPQKTGATEDAQEASATSAIHESSVIALESAKDAAVDFSAIRAENPDVFSWIYIPDTNIDCPIMQSTQSDDFYESHNVYGEEDSSGALYIELANLDTMCDFNTVIHGKTGTEGNGIFADLYKFSDLDFFNNHESIYLYLDGNVLTYEIIAAYERDNTSLLRTYDFTYLSGCQKFLDDLYSTRDMNRKFRNGWDFVNPCHFLITLTTQKEDNADSQFIVVAVLIKDAAGTISRIMEE